jgi:putative Mg2+ transporter-C (MgtC) family protein
MSPLVMLGRLLLAALCSGFIGYERETAQKSAGLRTHTLVGVGAAVFTVASISGFDGPDESRVAAQIVTGVGFLGAGAIFRDGQFVSGLTTAAGLWVVASLGMAAGSGTYWLAGIGTVVTLGTLYGLRAVDATVLRRKAKVRRRLQVHVSDVTKLESLLKFIHRLDPDAKQLDFKRVAEGGGVLVVSCNADDVMMMSEMLASHRTVKKVNELSALHWPQDKGDNTGR